MIKDEIKKGIACDSVGKPDSVLGRAVCLTVHPGKMLLLPFHAWFNRRYRGRYSFPRLLFSMDLLLLGAIIGLGVAALFLSLHRPAAFENKILFEVTVAPREIVSGSPSTLIIRYTNGTDETLRDVKLSLTTPDHFLLQELWVGEAHVEQGTIALDDIPVGGTGTVRLRGVMFGDVGGSQAFTSSMEFVHGQERDLYGRKTSVHTFSPTASTLALSLTLPPRLVAFQEVQGTISYHNTGAIDFPMISIEPEWPDGFTFVSSPVAIKDGVFILPAIEAGEEGTMSFTGSLGDVGKDVTFVFHPSFTFDQSRYRQETLRHTAPVVLAQVRVEHGVDSATVVPGGDAVFTVRYENVGEFDVSDLTLAIETDSPFVRERDLPSVNVETLAKGQSGEAVLYLPLRASILQSQTDVWEALDLTTRAVATYSLGDPSTSSESAQQRVVSKSASVSAPITTPVVFESFGRYATPSGDQLGRGPLPPRVGLTTKYWVFWRVGGTINELRNVHIEGTLGEGVAFTGRQSSSQSGGVEYDVAANAVRWQATAIAPSLSPTSKIVGVAFELGITPDQTMVGRAPALLTDIRLTGTDARTGAFISRSGATVTTDLPNDLMASGKALILDPPPF